MEETSNVQVVVRVRPWSEREKAAGCTPVVSALTEKKQVAIIRGKGAHQTKTLFHFDHVFTSFSTQVV